MFVLVLLLAACGGGGTDSTINTSASSSSSIASVASDNAASAGVGGEIIDERPELLDMLGPPDTFTIAFHDVDGEPVRYETWSYHELGRSIDLVDGGIAWDWEIEPPVDGSLYPAWYDPSEFTVLMSRDEALAVLATATGEATPVESIPLDPEAPDYEGGEIVVGDQIVLGFAFDQLVFVETYYFEPDGEGT